MTPIIEGTNISYAIESLPILENISFSIAYGDYVGLIGPNGGGKSTLIKIMLGLIKPTQGKIKLMGKDLKYFLEWENIGYVPQGIAHSSQYIPASVEEIINSGISQTFPFNNKSNKNIDISNVLDLVGIKKLKGKLIHSLSGGERQLVFIARALVTNPKLLILDEPTTGVDISSLERFYSLLKNLNENKKITIIMVSHDVDVISKNAKHIICVNKQLICHSHHKNIDLDKMIEKMYGKKVKKISHFH